MNGIWVAPMARYDCMGMLWMLPGEHGLACYCRSDTEVKRGDHSHLA
jgi:hypothetical protein